jgi:hypothetical protein
MATINSHEALGGIREPGVSPVAPTVRNALFSATGKRVRKLPIPKLVEVLDSTPAAGHGGVATNIVTPPARWVTVYSEVFSRRGTFSGENPVHHLNS